MKRRCPKCSAEWELKGPVGFREECPECAAYLHICTNCRHYDAVNRGCRIPTTEPVREPSEINFCEEYEYNGEGVPGRAPGVASGRTPTPSRSAAPPSNKAAAGDEARRRFEDLFRKPPT
jgi:hypothetical protein